MKSRLNAEHVAHACRLLASFKSAAEVEAELMKRFELSQVRARRVVQTARRELISPDVSVDREEQRSKIRASLHELVRDAATRGYHRHWLNGLQALVELDGLAEATRVAVEHYDSTAPVLGKRALMEQLQKLEARALAKSEDGEGN